MLCLVVDDASQSVAMLLNQSVAMLLNPLAQVATISDGELIIKVDATYKGRDVAIEEDHSTKSDIQGEPFQLSPYLPLFLTIPLYS